jgi:hypothetical protein
VKNKIAQKIQSRKKKMDQQLEEAVKVNLGGPSNSNFGSINGLELIRNRIILRNDTWHCT